MSSVFEIKTEEDYLFSLIFLEIGKLWIKELVCKDTCRVDLLSIAGRGREELRLENYKKLDLEDRVYFMALRGFIEGYERTGSFGDPVPLLLDSTASGQQILALINKVESPKILKELNLFANTEWYDPYLIAIRDFLTSIKDDSTDCELNVLSKYFTRKALKKPIMTSFYNSTLYRSRKDILGAIDGADEKELRIILKFIPKFYKFINADSIKKRFNLESIKDVKPLKDSFDYNYYSPGKREYRHKLTIDGRLRTISFHSSFKDYMELDSGTSLETEIDRVIDQKKTETARSPNTVHNIDSDIACHIIRTKDLKVYSIHDMFICSIYDKHLVYDRINQYYTEKIKSKYSLTIII